jgi:hypothetical protein
MAVKIPQGFMAPVTIGNFTDANGNPTTVDAVISTVVSDPTKAEILDVGGVQYVAPLATGNVAGDNQQVIVTCDVRFGPEVREVSFIATFDIPPGEAASAEVSLGAIEPRPA